MNFDVGLVLLGCLGGIVPDLLRFVKDKTKLFEAAAEPETEPKQPKKNPFTASAFWLGLLGQVILGGLVVFVFQIKTVETAILLGYAAPEIITRFFADNKDSVKIPKVDDSKREPDKRDDNKKETFLDPTGDVIELPLIRERKKFNLRSWWGV